MAETGWKGINEGRRPPLDPSAEMEDSRKERRVNHSILEIKAAVDMFSTVVSLMALLMLAASVFTLPFPFARKIWLEEVWGYYGLMNTCTFLLIAAAMKRMSLAAVVIGLGVMTYDQLLTWRGLLFLYHRQGLGAKAFLFVALSLVVVGILIAVFASSYHAISRYYRLKRDYVNPSHREAWILRIPASLDAALFAGSAAAYLLLFAASSAVASYDPKTSYALLRILGGAATVLGFFGIGLEAEKMIRTGAHRPLSLFKICVHAAFLIGLLRLIEFKMPLELAVR